MTLKNLSVNLHGQASYFAGQRVTGHLRIHATRPKRITDLSLGWTGTAKIFAGFAPNAADRPALASETYFDARVSLLQHDALQPDDDASGVWVLAAGLHTIPFEFTLPNHCPSSFQEPYAEVKYAIQLQLTRPPRLEGQPNTPFSLLVPFTVNGLYDLNKRDVCVIPPSVHSAKPPVPKDKAKKGGRLSRKLSLLGRLLPSPGVAPIGFSVQLVREAVVPGEFLQFRVDMFNNTKYDVTQVTLGLFQETKYLAGGVVKTGLRQKLCSADGPVVCARSTETWETNVDDSLYLQVPPVPPTNLGLGPSACKLVSLEYFLQLEMQLDQDAPSVKHGRVKGQIPVVVGNVPLRATFAEFISLPDKKAPKRRDKEEQDCNNNTERKGRATGLALGYADLCDPTFQEAANSYSAAPPPLPNALASTSLTMGRKTDEETEYSDDEFLATFQKEARHDFEFVPKYATYTSVHGLDLAELVGPLPGLPQPPALPLPSPAPARGSRPALESG